MPILYSWQHNEDIQTEIFDQGFIADYKKFLFFFVCVCVCVCVSFCHKSSFSLFKPTGLLVKVVVVVVDVGFFFIFFIFLWMDCLSKLNFIHDHIIRICLFYIHDNIMRIFKLKYLTKDSLLTIKNAFIFILFFYYLFIYFLCLCVCVSFGHKSSFSSFKPTGLLVKVFVDTTKKNCFSRHPFCANLEVVTINLKIGLGK